MQPLSDRVLIEPIEEASVTKSGITIVRSSSPLPVKGRIVALGPGRLTKKGIRLPHVAEEGDLVIFPQRAGEEVTVDGQQFVIVREDDLLAKLNPNGTSS